MSKHHPRRKEDLAYRFGSMKLWPPGHCKNIHGLQYSFHIGDSGVPNISQQ